MCGQMVTRCIGATPTLTLPPYQEEVQQQQRQQQAIGHRRCAKHYNYV